ncbi:hypothetical protein CcaCcLH18_03950 [Colletotrichum camelliae]|nr:hypothetical protein CcaCcLH18_03950 [Colletotrichum camelliae]
MSESDLFDCLTAYAWKISGTRLGMISIRLEADPDADPEAEFGRRFHQKAFDLLGILRDMCSWPRVANPEMPMSDLRRLRGFVDDDKKDASFRKGIVAYLKQPSFVLKGLSSKCEQLLASLQINDSEDLVETPVLEDFSKVHKEFLPILRTYTACGSCQPRPKRNEDDVVRFDVITSSVVDHSWQDVCIDMPMLRLSSHPVDMDQDGAAADNACCQQKLRMDMEPLATFCEFFQHDDGCRITLKLEDGVLLRLGAEALKHRTSPGKGLALADVLEQYELSVKERLALAHAIVLAFWQFYDSELMHRPWNSQTIWFMPEPDLRGNSEKLPLKVYISFHPEATECAFDSTEFATTRSLIHRCPRIQALAILLLEIGLGKPLRCPHFDRETLSLNYRYSLALQHLEDLKYATWDNFAHKHIYTDAVEDCLKFDGLMGKERDTCPYDSSSRRQLMHERVLSRLEWLNRAFRGRDDEMSYLSTRRALEQPQSNKQAVLVTLPKKLPARPVSEVHRETGIQIPNRPRSRQDFRIAIICALAHEADAVEALFDAHWDENGPSYDKAPQDPNAYSTGSIGRHNVVLAHMPGMGKANATRVATFCRISFPNITLALIVGICGAVPFIPGTGDEIVLGDVIISDGVVQYDFGRRRPNTEIRSLLTKLKGIYNKEALRNKTPTVAIIAVLAIVPVVTVITAIAVGTVIAVVAVVNVVADVAIINVVAIITATTVIAVVPVIPVVPVVPICYGQLSDSRVC